MVVAPGPVVCEHSSKHDRAAVALKLSDEAATVAAACMEDKQVCAVVLEKAGRAEAGINTKT